MFTAFARHPLVQENGTRQNEEHQHTVLQIEADLQSCIEDVRNEGGANIVLERDLDLIDARSCLRIASATWLSYDAEQSS